MTEDHYKQLVAMLLETIAAQHSQIAGLSERLAEQMRET